MHYTADAVFYICPACGDFFEELDLQEAGGIWHCLRCNHHYPADSGNVCHNCGASLKEHGIKPVKTKLTAAQIDRLSEWSKQNGYKRGTWVLNMPNGDVFEGGIYVGTRRQP